MKLRSPVIASSAGATRGCVAIRRRHECDEQRAGSDRAEGDRHQPAGAAERELADRLAEGVVVTVLDEVQRDDYEWKDGGGGKGGEW